MQGANFIPTRWPYDYTTFQHSAGVRDFLSMVLQEVASDEFQQSKYAPLTFIQFYLIDSCNLLLKMYFYSVTVTFSYSPP